MADDCVSGECDNNAGGGCDRVQRFSTPDTSYSWNGNILGDSGTNCVEQINSVRAEVAEYFVCNSTADPLTPVCTAIRDGVESCIFCNNPDCPDTYIKNDNMTSWFDHQQIAKEEFGGSLMKVTSSSKNVCALALYPSGGFYIGARGRGHWNEINTPHRYYWVSKENGEKDIGDPIPLPAEGLSDVYMNWQSGQPDCGVSQCHPDDVKRCLWYWNEAWDDTACEGGTPYYVPHKGLYELCNDDDMCTLDTYDAGEEHCIHTLVICGEGEVCNPLVGCTPDCDDGNMCTVDRYDAGEGECMHTPVICEPGDVCDPLVGCYTAPDCDDDNMCTVDTYNKGEGECMHTPVICEPGGGCDPLVGCIPNCDDGDMCTVDRYDAGEGECMYTPVICEPGDVCDPLVGCYTAPDCDDDNMCTVDTYNKGEGECMHTPVICEPGGGCDPLVGCIPNCDDGDMCTVDTYNVSQGVCVYTPIVCGEGEVCNPATGNCYVQCNWSRLGASITSLTLSADGQVVAIGASHNDDNGDNSGSVRVFQLDANDAWVQKGNDIYGLAAEDTFGTSADLSADGSILAVGAKNAGHVRIFQFIGGTWSQLGGAINGSYCRTVALSHDGSTVAVESSDVGYGGLPRAHVYRWNNVTWNQVGNDILGSSLEEHTGRSVRLSGDGTVLAIGSTTPDAINPSTTSGNVKVL